MDTKRPSVNNSLRRFVFAARDVPCLLRPHSRNFTLSCQGNHYQSPKHESPPGPPPQAGIRALATAGLSPACLTASRYNVKFKYVRNSHSLPFSVEPTGGLQRRAGSSSVR